MARITNMLKDSIPSKENEQDKGTSEKSAKIEQNEAFKMRMLWKKNNKNLQS